MAEKWTKTSFPPSRSIKPKPLSPLNHLTVPLIRSDIVFASFGNSKNFFRICLFHRRAKQNSPRIETVSCGCSSNQRNLPLSYKNDNNRLTKMSQPIFVNNIYEL